MMLWAGLSARPHSREAMSKITLKVNGKTNTVDVEPATPLLYVLRNDLGLYSEEYDQGEKRLIGNFPQAFTHLTLISSAVALKRSGAVDGNGSDH